MTVAVAEQEVLYERPRLYPKQEDAIFSEKRYSVIEASTKSGKTVGCIVWLHEKAALEGGPNKHYWWIAPIRRQSRIAFRRLKVMLPPGSFHANETEMSIRLLNGAVIVFLGAEDPDTLYGEDVYAAVIDEATRIKALSWYAIRSTLTATQGPVRIIGNVKGSRNWAYQLARRAEAGSAAYHYAKLTVWDAVDAGIFPEDEALDAKETLPDSIYRELYLAEPADGGDRFIRVEKIGTVADWPRTAKVVRVWDFAVTPEDVARDPDYTAGVKMAFDGRRTFIIDVIRQRAAPDKVLEIVKRTVELDGPTCAQLVEEHVGAAGKMILQLFRELLKGIPNSGRLHSAHVTGQKPVRAFHFAADCNDGHVAVVHGPWNETFLSECDNFPDPSDHDDQVDAAAHGYNFLRPNIRPRIRYLG